MTAPRLSRRTYVFAYLALLALTLITTLIAYLNLGVWSTVIAIGIATVMASIVAGIMMHALYESLLIRIIVSGGIIWFFFMITLTLGDYISRGWLPVPGK
ncbi:MAG: oxidase [Acidobacteriaceae bacterium]|nr:oxidase [Acidobacteriaceae bacterium]MBV8571367.1 oxidase [Acidobacteriaceae bacterium]